MQAAFKNNVKICNFLAYIWNWCGGFISLYIEITHFKIQFLAPDFETQELLYWDIPGSTKVTSLILHLWLAPEVTGALSICVCK